MWAFHVEASVAAEHRLEGVTAAAVAVPALEHRPIVVALRPSCSVACGIFLDQESNLCLLN